jgi:F0F1-type ATP synthase epsilon subunit
VEVAGDAVRVLADLAAEKDAIDAAQAREAKGEGEARRLTVVGNEQLDSVNDDVAFAEAKLAVVQGG